MKEKAGLRQIAVVTGVLAVLCLWHLLDVRSGAETSGDSWLTAWYLCLCAFCIGVVWLLGVAFHGLGKRRRWKLEQIYPAAALSLGLLYLFVLAPLSAPDEVTHYMTAYTLSSRMLGRPVLAEDGRVLIRARDLILEDARGDYILDTDGPYWTKTGIRNGVEEALTLGQELNESTYRTIHDVMAGTDGSRPVEPEDTSGGTEDTSGGTEDTSGGPKDMSGGTEDTSGGTEDMSGGTEDTSGGTEDTSGGTEDTSGGTETLAASEHYTVNTTPVAYLPQAVGISVARLLHLNSIWLVYLGRLMNLLFFVGMTWLALRRLPFGREVLFGVALLPMTLHLSASLSYDVMILGCMFLFTAVCLDLAYARERVRPRDVALLAVLMAAAGPCKMIYVLMMGLCLLIPVRKFGGRGKWLAAAAVVAGACAAAMALVNAGVINSYVTAADTALPVSGEEGFSLTLLLHKPLLLLQMFYNTILHQMDEFHLTMIGAQLGALDPVLSVPYILVVFYTAGLLLLAFRKPDENLTITGWRRGLIFAVCAACMAAAMLSMLIAWTPRTSPVIEGVQGRYFLPFLPVLLMACKNDRLVLTKDGNRSILYLMCCANLYVLMRLFSVVCLRL